MASLFLRIDEVCEMLGGISETAAKKALADHSIKGVDHGRGKRNGVLWYKPAILALAETLHEEAQGVAKPKRQSTSARIPQHPVRGKSIKSMELLLNDCGIPQ